MPDVSQAEIDAALDVLRAAGWRVVERRGFGYLTGSFLTSAYDGTGSIYTSTEAASPWAREETPDA